MKNKNSTRLQTLFLVLAVVSLPHLAHAKKPPKLDLETASPYLSPNKDGVQDQAELTVKVGKIKSVSLWELQIRDSSSAVRKTLSGKDSLPSSIVWDGLDDFNAPLPEGSYEASLTVWDAKSEPVTAPSVRLAIDLTPPTLSLTAPVKWVQVKDSAVPPISFDLSAVDLSGISKWEMKILDGAKNPFYSEASTGPLPAKWTLTAEKTAIPLGKLTAVFSVTDRAGNRSGSSPIDILVQEQGKPAPSTPPAGKSAAGKFLQLTSIVSIADLFGNDAGNQSALLPQAAILLEPLAKALLDSAGSRATLLGHVDAQDSAKEAAALSSYFAWKTYSFFVRERGVDKNAISVKGLGADVPIADNRTLLGRARNRRIEIQIFLPAEP